MLEEVEQEIAKLQRVADALRGSESKQSSKRGTGHGMSAAAPKNFPHLTVRGVWERIIRTNAVQKYHRANESHIPFRLHTRNAHQAV